MSARSFSFQLTFQMFKYLMMAAVGAAQFGGIFDQMFQQQANRQRGEQPKGSDLFTQNYYAVSCDKYLCSDSFACVDGPIDCPCPFPDSQLKCILPNGANYYCISKPTDDNGPDCDFVSKAWNGEV